MSDVRLTLSRPSERAVVERLVALDSKSSPAPPHLIAWCDGEPCAAISLVTGEVVADPFRRTAEVVELLRCHAAGAWIDRGIEPAPCIDAAGLLAA
jgi:hypothetical protein